MVISVGAELRVMSEVVVASSVEYQKNVPKFVRANATKKETEWPQEGDKKYKRVPCTRGDACNVLGCTFLHLRDVKERQKHRSTTEGKRCHRDLECRRPDCKYLHSEGWDALACRYGLKCNKAECTWNHPEGWYVAPDTRCETQMRCRFVGLKECDGCKSKGRCVRQNGRRCGRCNGCFAWSDEQDWHEEREREAKRAASLKPGASASKK